MDPEATPARRREAMIQLLRLGGVGAAAAGLGVWLNGRGQHPAAPAAENVRLKFEVPADLALPEMVVVQCDDPARMVRRAIQEAVGDFCLVQDADLEYDPRDYATMIGPLLDGRADMVYGSRFLSGPHRVMFFWHYVANRAVTLLSNMLSNLNLTDMETGMKGFVRAKLITLKLNANRFTFEPEITAKAARARWRIYEVPVSYAGRTYEEGKKIGLRDALTAVCAILYYRFFD